MKIMVICGFGLGSSFMVEMNIKKVLKKFNIDVEVEYFDFLLVIFGVVDFFVMVKDIVVSVSVLES